MKNYRLLLAIPLILLFSCKKDNGGDDGNNPEDQGQDRYERHLGENRIQQCVWKRCKKHGAFWLTAAEQRKWNDSEILKDKEFFRAQINTSQDLNPSYGYLTWLNGKAKYMLPTLQFVFNGPLVPNAPADMYCALGKNDQKIYVAPSRNLVVIRLGEAAGNAQLAMSSFDNEVWGKIRAVTGY